MVGRHAENIGKKREIWLSALRRHRMLLERSAHLGLAIPKLFGIKGNEALTVQPVEPRAVAPIDTSLDLACIPTCFPRRTGDAPRRSQP